MKQIVITSLDELKDEIIFPALDLASRRLDLEKSLIKDSKLIYWNAFQQNLDRRIEGKPVLKELPSRYFLTQIMNKRKTLGESLLDVVFWTMFPNYKQYSQNHLITVGDIKKYFMYIFGNIVNVNEEQSQNVFRTYRMASDNIFNRDLTIRDIELHAALGLKERPSDVSLN